jgi:hypothetical protein
MGQVVSGSGRVMWGCRVENHGPCPARHMCVSGQIWSGFGFSVIIFELSRVGSDYFLSSGENFGPCPTRRTVGSGFFEWVGSGLSGRAGHDQV